MEQALNISTAQGVHQKKEQDLAHNAITKFQMLVLLQKFCIS